MSNKYSYLDTQYTGSNPFGTQAKMLFHLDRLKEYLTKGDTRPLFIEINPTNKCNLKCSWCISENFRNADEIGLEYLKKFFKEFKDFGGKAITFSGGGEPTFYKYFKEAAIAAYKEGIDLGLMTNGVYPKEYNKTIGNIFDWVRFSLDTLNKDNYKLWKGVDAVNKVVKNIKLLKSYPIRVGINSNIDDKFNIEEVKELIDKILPIADYLQFRPMLPRYFKKEQPSLNLKVWDYLKSLKYNSKINLSDDKLEDILNSNFFPFDSCEGHFFNPVLNANGDICVCMYHPKDPRFVFGNIYKNSFEEIWKSDKRRKAIDFVRNLDYEKNCQICCKLTEINKFINFMKNPQKMRDINFL